MLQYKFQLFLFLLFAIILYYFKQKDVEFYTSLNVKDNGTFYTWAENSVTNRSININAMDFDNMINIGDIYYFLVNPRIYRFQCMCLYMDSVTEMILTQTVKHQC